VAYFIGFYPMKRLFPVLLSLFLVQCRTDPSDIPDYPGTSGGASAYSGETQQIINVSSYDPKERQREGRGFTENDVSALASNGSKGLIARAGKGGKLDNKCIAFVTSADRVGMLPGLYYRVQKHVSPVTQADQFVDRAQSLAKSRSWNAPALMLCGDYDGDLPLSSIVRFMDRVESRTGIVPVSYLENSPALKQLTSNADAKTRQKLLRGPYWLALYSHTSGAETPEHLVGQYGLWPEWKMWQYGGVEWSNGRSSPKVYSHGRYRNSTYFGDLDRPTERNVFKGSAADLAAFWQKHGIALQ